MSLYRKKYGKIQQNAYFAILPPLGPSKNPRSLNIDPFELKLGQYEEQLLKFLIDKKNLV